MQCLSGIPGHCGLKCLFGECLRFEVDFLNDRKLDFVIYAIELNRRCGASVAGSVGSPESLRVRPATDGSEGVLRIRKLPQDPLATTLLFTSDQRDPL